MSFITKRERVFNEYDLFDIPPRNEGKLKTYASCTDSRAWSHFNSDKAEHLYEIIKRNNDTCRTKYLPTDVIVNTLMVTKNAEIGRLKKKIEEFEQMLAAYDQLELTSEQKCEIANAHAAIKAANKELDDLCLDLDLSGFTEGIDSEAFETGKSRGDELSRYTGNETGKSRGDESGKYGGDDWLYNMNTMSKESKSSQAGRGSVPCPCDVSTSARDPRLDEMQETIIKKDAKLSAMHNKIAVMENDVCEPYCIYAHIYTALEKIFGTLCQNEKYKQYLDLLTAGKNTRCIDIKGKILFKMKVLEKFALALVAPCSQDFKSSNTDYVCYCTQIIADVDKEVFALTAADSTRIKLDDKRAQLVADIIDNQEMKEILSKESIVEKNDLEQPQDCYGFDSYSIETESLNRLKSLQANYEDLLNCYDNLKHEKDCLFLRCQKYTELEKECECMQNRLREYNQLWSEKEYHRKRSDDLDKLKESFYILTEETTNIESKLKAEIEINKIKSKNINELHQENMTLEKKIQDFTIKCEKEKNYLNCKIKDQECKIMCQEQQIKSLSNQIDKFLEQGHDAISSDEATRTIELLNEIESQKEEIKSLKEAMLYNEDEQRYLQEDFRNKLELINDLKVEVEKWKEKYDKVIQANDYLGKCSDNYLNQVQQLQHENKYLSEDIDSKKSALDNLMNMVQYKSQEINNLTDKIEDQQKKNLDLDKEIKKSQEMYNKSLTNMVNEKEIAIESLKHTQQESQEIFEAIKFYVTTNNSNVSVDSDDKAKSSQKERTSNENASNNSALLKEIKKLHEISIESLHALLEESVQYKKTLDLSKQDSLILQSKVQSLETLNEDYIKLKASHDRLKEEKEVLESELNSKNIEMDSLIDSFELTQKESKELLKQLNETENVKDEYLKLRSVNQMVLNDRKDLMLKLRNKEKILESMRNSINDLKNDNELYILQIQKLKSHEQNLINLNNLFTSLKAEKDLLQQKFELKQDEVCELNNIIESKSKENKELISKITATHTNEMSLKDDISSMQATLIASEKENAALKEKIKNFQNIESDMHKLKSTYDGIITVKDSFEKDVHIQQRLIQKLREENKVLSNQNTDLLDHSEDLQNSLLITRSKVSLLNPPDELLENIKAEINTMKDEKLLNHRKIRDLNDKLDEADDIIVNLKESIAVRDSKLGTLQNYINELQEEVRHLNGMIVTAVESSEQILDNSDKKLDNTLRSLEAHHSKVTHNMTMEITRLKSDNSQLDNKLSSTIVNNEAALREKEKFAELLSQLQNERESMIQNIKQFEIICFGDSNLYSESCSLDEILISLNRIRKCIEVRNTKNFALENKLLKVQNSSQILLSKADEAKKIAEKEKEKIDQEKEEALKEKIAMEQQLASLEMKLVDQITKDQQIIENLNGTLLNQKLMLEKINDSTQIYITNLTNEIDNLQVLYQNTLSKVNELQDKLQNSTEENSKNLETVSDLTRNLDKKQKEINHLRKYISEIQNKPTLESECQTTAFNNLIENSCQTEHIQFDFNHETKHENVYNRNDNSKTSKNFMDDNIDYIKSMYLNYKLNQLGRGKLELNSISGPENSDHLKDFENTSDIEDFSKNAVTSPKKTDINTIGNHHKIIDIYNTHSILTQNTDISSKSLNMGSIAEFIKTKYQDKNETNEIPQISDEKSPKNSPENYSNESENNDLFLIYKDSDVSPNEYNKKPSWPNQVLSNVIVETLTLSPRIEFQSNENSSIQNSQILDECDAHIDNNIIKPKLKVTVPRVNTDSASAMTISDFDKKSHDSNSLAIYTLPKRLTNSDHNIYGKSLQSSAKSSKSNNSILSNEFTNEILKSLQKKTPPNGNLSQKSNYIRNHNKRDNNLKDFVVLDRAIKNNKNAEPFKNISINKTISPLSERKKDHLFTDNKSSSIKSIEVSNGQLKKTSDYALEYILDSVKEDINVNNFNAYKNLQRSQSEENLHQPRRFSSEKSESKSYNVISSPLVYSQESDLLKKTMEEKIIISNSPSSSLTERAIMVKLDKNIDNENKIEELAKAIQEIEKHYKNKIEMIKTQYNNNIKNIMNEHDHGVNNIQSLHEEALQDAVKSRESEIESLRTMSIEAMRKVELLESENRYLKSKLENQQLNAPNEMHQMKVPSSEPRKRKHRYKTDRILSKTNVEAFNFSPKSRSHGPCTCTLDLNLSDTIRNIFEQVDVDQRKLGEHAYTRYIANKIINTNIDTLDAQELAFLHLKVCRTWKTMLGKEEALQKRINSLEIELLNKQRQTQQHIVELDRKVAEERRRLQEVREAVCRSSPVDSCDNSPERNLPEKDVCKHVCSKIQVEEKRSAGDVAKPIITATLRPKRPKQENSRAVSAKLDSDDRKEKKHYHDEQPVRLRRTRHDRGNKPTLKK